MTEERLQALQRLQKHIHTAKAFLEKLEEEGRIEQLVGDPPIEILVTLKHGNQHFTTLSYNKTMPMFHNIIRAIEDDCHRMESEFSEA